MQCNSLGIRRPYNPSRLLQRICMWYQLLLRVSGCESLTANILGNDQTTVRIAQLIMWETAQWCAPPFRTRVRRTHTGEIHIIIPLIICLPPNPIISNECMTTNVRQQHHHHHQQVATLGHGGMTRPYRDESSRILRQVPQIIIIIIIVSAEAHEVQKLTRIIMHHHHQQTNIS